MIHEDDPIKKYEPLWGSWYVTDVLGEGSFGRVYRAERTDASGSFLSAVKLISVPQKEQDFKDILEVSGNKQAAVAYLDDLVSKIVKEISVMYALRDEFHIVKYEDHLIIPNEDHTHWDILVRMELLIPLAEYLQQNAIGENEICELGVSICNALDACAKYGIIHRDVKEGNVFISPKGVFKLGDFGIARENSAGLNLSVRGTPAYIAPEVYKGEPYDNRADIYSLGILLYRLLNHRRAPFLPSAPSPITFDDQEKAFAKRIGGETIVPPALGAPWIQEVILKACAFSPRERYQSAADMRTALLRRSEPANVLPVQYEPAPALEETLPYQYAPDVPVQAAAPEAPAPAAINTQPPEPPEAEWTKKDRRQKWGVVIISAAAFVALLVTVVTVLYV